MGRRILSQIPKALHNPISMGLAAGGGVILIGCGTGAVELSEISLQLQPVGSPVTIGGTVGMNSRVTGSSSEEAIPITVVMIGMTGHGKSESGNTLIGKKWFGASNSSKSCTAEVARKTFRYKGIDYLAIDLPGFEDTNHTIDDIQKQLALVAHHAKGHVHALVIVHRRGRATKEVQKVIDYVVQQFGEEALLKYGVLVLTDTTECGDDIRLDVRDLPEANLYRQLVLSLPRERVMTLQNAYFSEFYRRSLQRNAILQQIRSIYATNEKSLVGAPNGHLDCEAFRKKRLEDEETRLKEQIQNLQNRNRELENSLVKLSFWRRFGGQNCC